MRCANLVGDELSMVLNSTAVATSDVGRFSPLSHNKPVRLMPTARGWFRRAFARPGEVSGSRPRRGRVFINSFNGLQSILGTDGVNE